MGRKAAINCLLKIAHHKRKSMLVKNTNEVLWVNFEATLNSPKQAESKAGERQSPGQQESAITFYQELSLTFCWLDDNGLSKKTVCVLIVKVLSILKSPQGITNRENFYSPRSLHIYAKSKTVWTEDCTSSEWNDPSQLHFLNFFPLKHSCDEDQPFKLQQRSKFWSISVPLDSARKLVYECIKKLCCLSLF